MHKYTCTDSTLFVEPTQKEIPPWMEPSTGVSKDFQPEPARSPHPDKEGLLVVTKVPIGLPRDCYPIKKDWSLMYQRTAGLHSR